MYSYPQTLGRHTLKDRVKFGQSLNTKVNQRVKLQSIIYRKITALFIIFNARGNLESTQRAEEIWWPEWLPQDISQEKMKNLVTDRRLCLEGKQFSVPAELSFSCCHFCQCPLKCQTQLELKVPPAPLFTAQKQSVVDIFYQLLLYTHNKITF